MPIKNGDTVVVHYVGTLADGSEFDRSSEGHPLSFRQGAGQMIPGFEKAMEGREKGERFTVTIPADEGCTLTARCRCREEIGVVQPVLGISPS